MPEFLLQRTWRELRGSARAAKSDPTVANLHTVRIRAKRMRYACEAATPVLGGQATTAKASEALQERLGDWHDACAARDWLEARAAAYLTLRQGRLGGGRVQGTGSRCRGGKLGVRVPRRSSRSGRGSTRPGQGSSKGTGFRLCLVRAPAPAYGPPCAGLLRSRRRHLRPGSRHYEDERRVIGEEPEVHRDGLRVLYDEGGDQAAEGQEPDQPHDLRGRATGLSLRLLIAGDVR